MTLSRAVLFLALNIDGSDPSLVTGTCAPRRTPTVTPSGLLLAFALVDVLGTYDILRRLSSITGCGIDLRSRGEAGAGAPLDGLVRTPGMLANVRWLLLMEAALGD